MGLTDDLNAVQSILTRYVLLIFFLFGVIGSVLNILVFSQRNFRMNSCSVYFISTSIFNFLVMFFGIIPIVYPSYSSYDLASYSVGYCKFRTYILHVFLMMSRSSVALASIDRFASCSSNVKVRALCQRSLAIRFLAVVFLLWLLLPIHMLTEVTIQMPSRRCVGDSTYSVIYSVYAAVVTTIPLVIMITFSFLAVRNLRRARARVHANLSVDHLNVHMLVRMRNRDVQFTVILISEVIIYLLSTVLFPMYSIYNGATILLTKTADRQAIEGFMRYLVLNFLIYLNSCSIFYVHLLASAVFRQECKRLFLHLFKKTAVHPVSVISNMNNQPRPIQGQPDPVRMAWTKSA